MSGGASVARRVPTAVLRQGGRELMGDPRFRSSEEQRVMAEGLSRALDQLRSDSTAAIERNTKELERLGGLVDSRGAQLRRMQRQTRMIAPLSAEQQQQLASLEGLLDQTRRKRDAAVGENTRILRVLTDLKGEVDGLKQLVPSSSSDFSKSSSLSARGRSAMSSSWDSDAQQLLREQEEADAKLEEVQAMVRKHEAQLAQMRRDAAKFDGQYESALSKLQRAQTMAARAKLELMASSQAQMEVESLRRKNEHSAVASQFEQGSALRERRKLLNKTKSEAIQRKLLTSEVAIRNLEDSSTKGKHRGIQSEVPKASVDPVDAVLGGSSRSQVIQSSRPSPGDDGWVDAQSSINILHGANRAEEEAWVALVDKAGISKPQEIAERLAHHQEVTNTIHLERQAEMRLVKLVEEGRVLRARRDWLESAIARAATRRRVQLTESVASSSQQIEISIKQRSTHDHILGRARQAIRHVQGICAEAALTDAKTDDVNGADALQLAKLLAALSASLRNARSAASGGKASGGKDGKQTPLDGLMEASFSAAAYQREIATRSRPLRPTSASKTFGAYMVGSRLNDKARLKRSSSAKAKRESASSQRKANASSTAREERTHVNVLDALVATGKPKLEGVPAHVLGAVPLTATDRLLSGLVVS
eukprot:scaffold6603_cov27-Tisochrysis_lutea.AAC.4